MSVSTKKIGKNEVVVVDCSGMNTAKSSDIVNILQDASTLVASKPPKSVHIISDVTDLKFNIDVANAYKEYASTNTPYIKESVLVGLSGMQNVIFSAIKAMTGRNFKLVNTMEEAEKYLSSI